MITPRAWKKDLYLAIKPINARLDENGEPTYETPIAFTGNNGINYQPLSSRTDVELYGLSVTEMVKAVVLPSDRAYAFLTKDIEGSKAYLFGASPTTKPIWDKSIETSEYTNGYWANYIVDRIEYMQFHKTVYFKQIKSLGSS